MNWIKQNQIIVAALIVAAAIVSYGLLWNKSEVGDRELFSLNEECAAKARELAEQQSGKDNLGTAVLQVLHSTYDAKRKSCFAEMDVAVKIDDIQSPYKDFRVRRIYDVLKEDIVSSWAYEGGEQWEPVNTLEDYGKLKKEIFGLEIYE
ncbi:MAG: hypothetical protein HY455_03550 [Parcubacteria group bacterium]|nr:hypothetical protein [Parcubacteria group bacterium]